MKWTGLEFAKSQRAVENREKWRKLAVKSSGRDLSTTFPQKMVIQGWLV